MTLDELRDAALALPESDRVLLIEALELSFSITDQTLTPRQRVDLAQRIAEYEADPEGTTVDGPTAFRELREQLARMRPQGTTGAAR